MRFVLSVVLFALFAQQSDAQVFDRRGKGGVVYTLPVQGGCANGQCAVPSVAVSVTTGQQFRAPVGHTHTCTQCGNTWDHLENPGHKCTNCGSTQFVADSTPRPVPVRTIAAQPKVTPKFPKAVPDPLPTVAPLAF